MPQPSERSFVTPMIRPRLPCITVPFAAGLSGMWFILLRVAAGGGTAYRRGARAGDPRLACWPARRQSALAREKDQSMPDAASSSPIRLPGSRMDGGGRGARTGRRQRDDPGDCHAGRRAVGPHRAAEGRRCRGASCSTPTSRAARARNSRRTRAPRCCFTGSRWAARSASKARSSTLPTPKPMHTTPRARAYRGSVPGRRTSHAHCPIVRSWSAALLTYEARYPGDDIPRPPHWSGYPRRCPQRFEFWQNMPFRLHDRTRLHAAPDGGWTIGKLFP